MTGLDLVSKDLILGVIAEERSLGRSVVMTTHSLEEAAAGDLVVLLAGRMIAAGPPESVLTAQHLADAFGAHVLRLRTGQLLLDDPHHMAGA